ncbi:MAG: hypothetical protein OEZ02_13815, partial [Anaerolineae bacterium]|nr:hypothetical protein [Anaerolineae bacterium]
QDGPWLMYPQTRKKENGILISNLDGSSAHYLELKVYPTDIHTNFSKAVSPHGGFVALHVLVDSDGETDLQLWIFKLPTLDIIQKIPLFSEEALLVQDAFRTSNSDERRFFNDSPVLFSIVWKNSLSWSNDGRYLAFAGALDGPSSDVYIYDTQQKRIQRLTDEADQVVLMGWSPDNRAIVYSVVSEYKEYRSTIETVNAVSVEEVQTTVLYDSLSSGVLEEIIIGWIDNDTSLIISRYWEGAPHNLRAVNLLSGQVQTLYASFFWGPSFDASNKLLFLDIGTNYGSIPDIKMGFYQLDLQTNQLIFLFPEDQTVTWLSPMSQFAVVAPDRTLSLVDQDKKLNAVINGDAPRPEFFPSPDGKWLIIEFSNGPSVLHTELYTSAGEHIRSLNPNSEYIWLRDSSGVISYNFQGFSIYLYMLDNEWQRETIGRNCCNQLIPKLVYP